MSDLKASLPTLDSTIVRPSSKQLTCKAKKMELKALKMHVMAESYLTDIVDTLQLPDGWGAQFCADDGIEYYNENDESGGFDTYVLDEVMTVKA